MYTSSLRSHNLKSGKISGKIRQCATPSLGLQEEHTDWCVTFSCKVQLQKNCIMSGIHFLPYILCLFFKKDFEKPWSRTSSRFVWFSEVLRFKATLRGDALLFWYASWSHTKSHLVTLTAIPITHRKWSGQKEYFTQNPKGRIWDLSRYFSDDAVFWLLHNYSRTFQITYLLCTNLVQNTKYALLMNLPDICWLILR